METLLPSALVPGLVTIKNKKGQTQNVYPIDAKELIASGDYDLVENGSAEAARLNANPLRSGRSQVDNPDLIVAEIAGINGGVVVAADEKTATAAIKAGDNADRVPANPDPKTEAKPAAKPAEQKPEEKK